MSLVESWPSTEMRSNERFTHTPSSRSAVSASSAASVCTKQSMVAKLGWIIPAPLAWALIRTVPDGSATSSESRFSNASVVAIARQNAASPSARQLAAGGDDRARDAVHRHRHADHAGRATATRSSCTPAAIAAAPCMRAASSRPRRPVAAFALPELTTTARSASSRQRSWHSSTGAASTPERVKRAARTVSGSEQTSSAEVGVAGRLDPGRHAGGAEAGRRARRRDAR